MEQMTLIGPLSKSDIAHFKPNISFCRNPVDAARRTSVRSRSARPSINALISAGTRMAGGVRRFASDERGRLGAFRTTTAGVRPKRRDFWNALNREISESGKNLGRIVAP